MRNKNGKKRFEELEREDMEGREIEEEQILSKSKSMDPCNYQGEYAIFFINDSIVKTHRRAS